MALDEAHPGDPGHVTDHNELLVRLEQQEQRAFIQGPEGPRGVPGPKGDPGVPGPKGDPGAAGVTGNVGPAGPKGDKGDVGSNGPAGPEGPVGPKGDRGDVGPAGPVGPVGPQGQALNYRGKSGDVSYLPPTGNQPGDAWTVEGQNGFIYIWSGTVWEKTPITQVPGPAGPAGPEGPAGPAGAQGPLGPQGERGPTGVQGPKGDAGPAGPKGDPGPAGPTGADSVVPGPQGPAGPAGPKGDAGPAGADSTVPGPVGPAGPKGDTGPQGPVGTGIQMLPAVATPGDLPMAGNSPGDARITTSTGELHVWDGAAWEPIAHNSGPEATLDLLFPGWTQHDPAATYEAGDFVFNDGHMWLADGTISPGDSQPPTIANGGDWFYGPQTIPSMVEQIDGLGTKASDHELRIQALKSASDAALKVDSFRPARVQSWRATTQYQPGSLVKVVEGDGFLYFSSDIAQIGGTAPSLTNLTTWTLVDAWSLVNEPSLFFHPLDHLSDVSAPANTPAGKVLGTTGTGAWGPVDPPASGLDLTPEPAIQAYDQSRAYAPGEWVLDRGRVYKAPPDGVVAWANGPSSADTTWLRVDLKALDAPPLTGPFDIGVRPPSAGATGRKAPLWMATNVSAQDPAPGWVGIDTDDPATATMLFLPSVDLEGRPIALAENVKGKHLSGTQIILRDNTLNSSYFGLGGGNAFVYELAYTDGQQVGTPVRFVRKIELGHDYGDKIYEGGMYSALAGMTVGTLSFDLNPSGSGLPAVPAHKQGEWLWYGKGKSGLTGDNGCVGFGNEGSSSASLMISNTDADGADRGAELRAVPPGTVITLRAGLAHLEYTVLAVVPAGNGPGDFVKFTCAAYSTVNQGIMALLPADKTVRVTVGYPELSPSLVLGVGDGTGTGEWVARDPIEFGPTRGLGQNVVPWRPGTTWRVGEFVISDGLVWAPYRDIMADEPAPTRANSGGWIAAVLTDMLYWVSAAYMEQAAKGVPWKRWSGTQAEYDALPTKDPSWLYVVTG